MLYEVITQGSPGRINVQPVLSGGRPAASVSHGTEENVLAGRTGNFQRDRC